SLLKRFAFAYDEFRVLSLAEADFDEIPAEQVLLDLRGEATTREARRLWLLLGEPGAGKSTLLEWWFDAWAFGLSGLYLGLAIPVLIRLKELQPDDFHCDDKEFSERLWRKHGAGTGSARLADHPAMGIYEPDRGRAFRPIWLMDGLDEIPSGQDEVIFERLVNLPGRKVVTCRTAVFEAMRDRAERYVEKEFALLPLDQFEQITFIDEVLEAQGRTTSNSKGLLQQLQQHTALRDLVTRPLTLQLVAEGEGLPRTLSAFYRNVVDRMWNRTDRLKEEEAARLYCSRDAVLMRLAKQMALDRFECTLDEFTSALEIAALEAAEDLYKALQTTGLVRIDNRRRVCEFFHATFQEFYLALALESEGLRAALDKHWADERYEETLALGISLNLEA